MYVHIQIALINKNSITMSRQRGGGGMELRSQTKTHLTPRQRRGGGVMGKNLRNAGPFSEKTPLAMKSNGLVRSVAIVTEIEVLYILHIHLVSVHL